MTKTKKIRSFFFSNGKNDEYFISIQHEICSNKAIRLRRITKKSTFLIIIAKTLSRFVSTLESEKRQGPAQYKYGPAKLAPVLLKTACDYQVFCLVALRATVFEKTRNGIASVNWFL